MCHSTWLLDNRGSVLIAVTGSSSLSMRDRGRDATGSFPAASRSFVWAWYIAAAMTVTFSVALAVLSRRFGYDVDVIEMPCLTFVALMVGVGAVYAIGLPRLIGTSIRSGPMEGYLAIALIAGLVARLILFASDPILEDDYNRYLWDGGVTAGGYNPYWASPLAVLEGRDPDPPRSLAIDAGPLLPRINHKSLTTIYPPVAQAMFALAHLVEPWSLSAWRAVLLVCDLATVGLLILLLDMTGRSRLWCALYWLNPVVLKEVFNSAHMEAVILPFVLLALLLASRRCPVWATGALSFAVGAKFWPVLLLPVILRQLWDKRSTLAVTTVLFACVLVLWLAPMLGSGSTQSSGLLAYVVHWQTNSALFPLIAASFSSLLSSVGLGEAHGGGLARVLIAFLLLAFSAVASIRRLDGADDLIARAGAVVAALVLLSPAQYPWYSVWLAPFLVFRPYRAFLLLTALIPLYYASFHFAAREAPEVFNTYVVWAIWVPVWTVLLWVAAMPIVSNRMRVNV